jgi:hypothetical protein
VILLFVCSENRLWSPMAEAVFCGHPRVNAVGAGTDEEFYGGATRPHPVWLVGKLTRVKERDAACGRATRPRHCSLRWASLSRALALLPPLPRAYGDSRRAAPSQDTAQARRDPRE